MNAFEYISMSQSFNLNNLFEKHIVSYKKPMQAIMCLNYYKRCSIPSDGEDPWGCVFVFILLHVENN